LESASKIPSISSITERSDFFSPIYIGKTATISTVHLFPSSSSQGSRPTSRVIGAPDEFSLPWRSTSPSE
jgi:hypothetical protein